jgi:hypothetical protein
LVVEERNLTNQEYLEHLATDSQVAAVAQLPVTLVEVVAVAQADQEWMHGVMVIPIIQEQVVQAAMAALAVLVISLAQQ